ncbi:uncharacterized protein E0L32_004159 [Thyridium curvatum]|uniref:Proteasome component ECM29 n=1 Tax=Thyridium curvatum TaxID=1093900 RepID=A0A507BBY1_9PEZI|nr:uncharacterized protein E0L32_004159 [Thyridium curvatum]TPX16164.1 hypothetical protein E0L32_004159 [Thyridium curvatum]
MANPSPEQRELDLVEKVDFRILSVANNEEKLQELLQRYLAPLLLKAGSEHASVRSKVITICQRLKTFIQPPGVVLPVDALLDQFSAAESPVLKQLDLMFIQHSIGRLKPLERRALIPKALRGISKEKANSSGLFNVVLRLLPDIKIPPRGSKEDVAFRDEIGLQDPSDAKFVAHWFGRLLLLKVTSKGAAAPGTRLKDAEVKFLTLGKPDTWNSSSEGGMSLSETRIRVANFLASGAFTDEERIMPALFASASTDSRVSSIGDDLLKRTTVSLEDKSLVRDLFEAHAVLATPYRTRILNLLSKSAVAATFTGEILAAVELDMGEARRVQESAGHPTPSKGLELTKLYRALFEFINWVARIGPKNGEFKIAGPLVDHMQEYIREQGFPDPKSSLDEDQVSLRKRAYETIGALAKGIKMTLQARLSLVWFMFIALTEDMTSGVVVNIDGALSSMTSLFQPPYESNSDEYLRPVLLKYIDAQVGEIGIKRSGRHAAVKWANNCFLFSDVTARWIDILAVAGVRDERSDVVEEGQKGLDPWTYYAHDSKDLELPDWQAMVKTFFCEPIKNVTSAEWRGETPTRGFPFPNFHRGNMQAFPVALNYCKQILLLTALKDTFKIEPSWERQLENTIQSDKQSRQAVRSYLKENSKWLVPFLKAAQMNLQDENGVSNDQSVRCIVDVLSLAPKEVVGELACHADATLPLIFSNKKEIRSLGARALGILAPHPSNPPESVQRLKQQLIKTTQSWATAVGSELNAVEGAFLALGRLVSRSVYYAPDSASPFLEEMTAVFPSAKEIEQMPVSLQDALFDSLAQLWTAGVPILTQEADEKKGLIDLLTAKAKKSNEKAISALGRLAISLKASSSGKEQDLRSHIIDKLYQLEEIKQAEVHFAVGEAITAAVARWDSDVVQLTLDVDVDSTSFQTGKQAAHVEQVLDKLLENCKSTKPSLLKASGIWLFCLIQHCSHLPEIQAKLREAQVAFMRLLSARDELVQETASRGLALVYEKGDPSLKDALVKDLVASFTGSGPRLKVDEDTELFDAGALPTGEGKSITSYKDIVNLANEVGDQSLIYKFMSLATNAATWSTRSAFGRFGLSNILSESEVDPKLYPKLYRYRFDPNENVQRSMNDIWKALVKDSNAVMEKHFDDIMDDLLKSILGKEWRVRQASCAAVSDLIQGRPFVQYEKYYKDIWAKALKVLDDVKTSVREAALRLCINLSNTLVRQLEEGGSSVSAVAMMKEALPFLMSEKGIESGVEDVKIFCTITVMKIAKNGGKSLKGYAADMIIRLLGLLSTIEPDAVNYHYLRSGEDSREKIDKLRSAMVSQSPISEAIENCLRNVDAQAMADLAPGLEGVIKSAIGMPTKIGCGRVLGTLATRHATDFAPFSARFLQLMEKQALDKNDEVSQSYAKAAAYIMRVAPSEARERFVVKFTDLYFTSEDEARRQKVADAVLALSKISPDHFNALESQLLPFVYLAKHDTDEYVQKEFEEVWDKHAGTSRAVGRYVTEIVALVQRCLDTPQWALKHGGALAVGAAVRAVTSASDLTGQVNVASLRALWPVFDKALALKTFPGKEKVLAALPDFAAKGGAFWGADDKVAAQLRKVAVREARRNNDAYRVHAFEALWKVAAAREDLDMLDEIVEIVGPHLDELRDEDRMDVDKKEGSEDLVAKTAAKGLEAIARGYSRPVMKEDSAAVLARISKAAGQYLASRQFDAIRRSVWYKAALDLMNEAAESASSSSSSSTKAAAVKADALALEYFRSLDVDKPDVGTEEQRSTRAKAVGALARALKKGAFGGDGGAREEAMKEIREVTTKALTGDRSLEVQRLLRDALGDMN